MTVGFAVPTIPPRADKLARALASIAAQTHPIAEVAIAVDIYKQGAADTRNRAKQMLHTQWTCFLDDDDELYPAHVAKLLQHAHDTAADLVFSWFDVAGGTDPFPQLEHLEWDDCSPHMFPITVLVRTELAQAVDFETPEHRPAGAPEDWTYWNALLDAGAHFAHLPERTWLWHHDSANTSGLASRW